LFQIILKAVILEKHPEWFAAAKLKEFPLLVKVLDANDNLSVQVHPDDQYARRNEKGESGKTECWYVIDSEPGAEIIFGHTAKNSSEFIQLAQENKWDSLLARVPARAGDFFFIPSGMVHAIGKGILLLEVQQNSDITYRIYDYDRMGLDGAKRALHFEKAIDVIDFQPANDKPEPHTFEEKGAAKTTLVSCSYFTVEKWLIKGMHDLKLFDVFLLIFIVSGEGELIYDEGSVLLKKGVSMMIPANMGGCRFVGNIEAIVSHI
jgi:mannose-6-phosphate isomerase